MKAVVTGAAGFIGHHLVSALKREGHEVIGIDVQAPPFAPTAADRFVLHDCRTPDGLLPLVEGAGEIYALAADMGGIGYISENHATIMRNNSLINLSTLDAARQVAGARLLFTSSACVYPLGIQSADQALPLAEHMAMPADPENGYGWEKLYSERLCQAYREQHGLETRVARLHNVYGPLGAWRGGREKAPAALCRKVAQAIASGEREIELWGDGKQVRSFCYVDDCVAALLLLMRSAERDPINVGRDDPVTIAQLAERIMAIAGAELRLVWREGPQGVRARNADETLARQRLGWQPRVDLDDGLRRTYTWVREQLSAS